jgi:hypothetical protein
MLEIEIIENNIINGGSEVFVRAWRDGTPIGFGEDGTIEIERILLRHENNHSYLYVPDEKGDFVVEILNEDGVIDIYKYREDPEEALLRRLEHIIDNIGKTDENIVFGKRGSTVTVIDQTTTTGDQLLSDAMATYALARDAATGTVSNMSGAAAQNWLHNSLIGTYYVRRVQIGFDTSSIPDGDTISAATMTVYSNATGGGDTDNYSVVLLNNTAAGTSSPLVSGDFDGFPSTSIGSLDLTSLTNIGANVAITLTDFAVINKTGTTLIGVRLSGDINNSTPTGSNLLRVNQAADYPFLTITHAAAASVNSNFFALM